MQCILKFSLCFLLLISSLSASDLSPDESGKLQEKIDEVQYRLSYIKFLCWLMKIGSIHIEDGLPWVIELINELEPMVDNLSQDYLELDQY